MIRLYHCKECGKNKDWSEMHNKTFCKNCWALMDQEWIDGRIKKTWETRRRRGTDKTKREKIVCPWCYKKYYKDTFNLMAKTTDHFYCSECKKKIYFSILA